MRITVGYLLSYDYHLFLTSVKQLYDSVDKIVVGIDQDYLTWSGNKFEIPQSFFDEIKEFDHRNIIEFYLDKFYLPHLSPMECETRERNMVLKKLGRGWKIQLDVDEYIYDFKKLKCYLEKYYYLTIFPKLTPIGFRGKLITLFKQTESGFLYIDNNEGFPFITNQESNSKARNNTNIFMYPLSVRVIHQSWARKSEEIYVKIKNWGHRDDFDVKSYFEYWNNLDVINYHNYINFHPMVPREWDKLYFEKASGIDEFIENYERKNPQLLQSVFNIKHFFKSCMYRIFKGK